MEVICKNPGCEGKEQVDVWDTNSLGMECPFCGELMIPIESNQTNDHINEQFCKDCQYAKKLKLSETNEPFQAFHCRRRAPIASANPWQRWPIVNSDDWCGEFKVRSDIKEG